MGVLLFFLAAALVIPAALAVLGKRLAAVVLGLAATRFAATGVFEYTGVVGWRITAGWIGLALGVAALVAAAAFGFEDARRVGLAATLRRARGEQAVTGRGLDTVGPVARAAGVRDQL